MSLNSNKKNQKPSSGSRVAALVILILIVSSVVGYLFTSIIRKNTASTKNTTVSKVVPGFSQLSTQKKYSSVSTSPSTPLPEYRGSVKPKISPPEKSKPLTSDRANARLAIIIDDMGSNISQARSLAAINLPLTFAIIPGLRSDRAVAEFASSRNIETLIHIPMQSKGWPERRLEPNGLLISMDTAEIEKRLLDFIQKFPEAVGINNHMGSEFTEQEEKMEIVMKILKKNDLFFIDSVTSPATVGMKKAANQAVKAARRNVFLDNEQENGYILGQLAQAVKTAKKSGSAIAICHPHPTTLAALSAALPKLAGQGVMLVPVSSLIR